MTASTYTPDMSLQAVERRDPARIYLQPACSVDPDGYEGRQWCEDDVWEECHVEGCSCRATTYVRADLAALEATPSLHPEGEGLTIPAGMKAWHGGDAAPADWDGGPVLHRDGSMIDGATEDSTGWRSIYDMPPAFAAYTFKTGDRWVVVPDGEPVTLNECPPGPFLFNGSLGFKSEYTTTLEGPRRYQVDAYCLDSGEYFWGGAKGTEARGKLVVQPLAASPKLAEGTVPDDGEACLDERLTVREGWTSSDEEGRAAYLLAVIAASTGGKSDAIIERRAVMVNSEKAIRAMLLYAAERVREAAPAREGTVPDDGWVTVREAWSALVDNLGSVEMDGYYSGSVHHTDVDHINELLAASPKPTIVEASGMVEHG